MASVSPAYTRLTRNASGFGTYSSLWVGQEDLILVLSTGYTEHYSRLRLRDIKGFFTLSGDRRLGWGLVWGVILFFSGVVAIVGWARHQAPVGSTIVAVLALILSVWNQLLGPACRMYVVTDVQVLPLPSVVRRPRARRLLDRLQPLILAAQADLAPAVPAPSAASGVAAALTEISATGLPSSLPSDRP